MKIVCYFIDVKMKKKKKGAIVQAIAEPSLEMFRTSNYLPILKEPCRSCNLPFWLVALLWFLVISIVFERWEMFPLDCILNDVTCCGILIDPRVDLKSKVSPRIFVNCLGGRSRPAVLWHHEECFSLWRAVGQCVRDLIRSRWLWFSIAVFRLLGLRD